MKTIVKIVKTFRRIVFFCNIVCSLFLITSNLAPVIDPGKYWPVALLGIVFPLLLIATSLFMLFWIPVQPKKALISLSAILISIPNIIATFAFNVPTKFLLSKEAGNIRVVTWNVELMNYNAKDDITAANNNTIIFNKLREANADIICLQEFFSPIIPGNYYNPIDSIAGTMGYPYHYFSLDFPKFEGKFYSGSIIFSRYKIIDTLKIKFPKQFTGSLIKAGILINGDTVDIFTTRLQSLSFQKNEYKQLHDIKNISDSAFTGSKNVIHKIKDGYTNRIAQIAIIQELAAESKHPVIFTGDMNDVPVSYTYSKMNMNMSNAWVQKGTGLGRTFKFISPTLRIDDIFFNKFFKASQITRIITDDASDHYGIVADLFLKKKEL